LEISNVEEDIFTLNLHYVDTGKRRLGEGGKHYQYFTFNESGVQYNDRSCVAFDFINFINDCIKEGSSTIKEDFEDVWDNLQDYIDDVVDELFRDYNILEK